MCPFDRVQIDAILEHLPQGGHLAQTTDGVADELDCVVDLFFGGEATDAETDGAVCQLVVQAEVQAEPEETARSFSAMMRDSPST